MLAESARPYSVRSRVQTMVDGVSVAELTRFIRTSGGNLETGPMKIAQKICMHFVCNKRPLQRPYLYWGTELLYSGVTPQKRSDSGMLLEPGLGVQLTVKLCIFCLSLSLSLSMSNWRCTYPHSSVFHRRVRCIHCRV